MRMLPVRMVQLRADARAAQQLHAGLEDGVGADGDVGIHEHGFGQLDGDARVHQRGALAAAEDQVHFGQIGARVAAEDFVGIGGDLREHGFALFAQQRDGVGEIQLAMLVVGAKLAEARPEFREREARRCWN